MKLVRTSNLYRLRCASLLIHSDLPTRALIPQTTLISEVDFYYRHRRLFGWLRLDASVFVRHSGKRWYSMRACLEATEPWVLRDPGSQPDQAVELMRRLLEERYGAHAFLRCWLFSTVGFPLRCDDARDAFWGCGPTGGGLNWLGKLHMDFREHRVPDLYRNRLQPFTYQNL